MWQLNEFIRFLGTMTFFTFDTIVAKLGQIIL